jgi:hypothetical protein
MDPGVETPYPRNQMTEEIKRDRVRGTLTLAGLAQFLGASSIVALITWSLTNFINQKNNQQQQLNTFITTISSLMIDKKLDSQADQTAPPPVSRAARGFALNTLESLEGPWPLRDDPKKQQLLKFLYDSRMIGYCKVPSLGEDNLAIDPFMKCVDPRVDLKDARLRSLSFQPVGEKLPGINLSKTFLKNSNFTGIDLRKSHFQQSELNRSRFAKTLLGDSDFTQAKLMGADFEGASITRTVFDRAQLCGASFKDVEGFEEASFNGAIIDSTTILTAQQRKQLLSRGALQFPCVLRAR